MTVGAMADETAVAAMAGTDEMNTAAAGTIKGAVRNESATRESTGGGTRSRGGGIPMIRAGRRESASATTTVTIGRRMPVISNRGKFKSQVIGSTAAIAEGIRSIGMAAVAMVNRETAWRHTIITDRAAQ